jgi:hypothetical protein
MLGLISNQENMLQERLLLSELSETVIGCFFKEYNTLQKIIERRKHR